MRMRSMARPYVGLFRHRSTEVAVLQGLNLVALLGPILFRFYDIGLCGIQPSS
ncbi:MAG: hypothetical protein MJE68_16070 [Proteobacteria bacterium]|nr:hypothetical protein [Pseudomonadota bacterium]